MTFDPTSEDSVTLYPIVCHGSEGPRYRVKAAAPRQADICEREMEESSHKWEETGWNQESHGCYGSVLASKALEGQEPGQATETH